MILRNICTMIILVMFIQAGHAQTLFTYGNKSVTKDEFLKAYGKNTNGEKATETSYREYADLYTKFKIKVQAAIDLRLDTLSSLKAELQNFRSQIAENYINDEGNLDELIDEAFMRSQKDIHVAHIFIPVTKDDSTKRVAQAQSKINKAAQALKTQTFEQVALDFSEDPSVKSNKGDIGFITVFVLPYPIENAVYTTPVGQYTKPFRSASGFHIFKVLGERKALGRIRVAQILVTSPSGTGDDKDVKSAAAKADSIYSLLGRGGDFKALAREFSADNLSYENGGELPEFGVGRYHHSFESAAFELKKDGEIRKPFRTEFGYHIIKRLEHIPVPESRKDQKWRESTRQLIVQSDRMAVSRQKTLKNLQAKTQFKRLPFNQKSLWQLTDSMLANKNLPKQNGLAPNAGLFSFAKQVVTVKDWQNYLESIRSIQSLVTGKTHDEILEQFIETSTLDYYRQHLEDFNKDFVYQLNEFREGNLLFEVMQRKVWDVASRDTVALKQYYEKNKDRYWWENSADAIIFTCADEKAAENFRMKLKSNIKSWRDVVDTENGSIQADSGRFELGQIPVVDRTNFREGLITANVRNDQDGNVTFAYILALHNKREPRSFEDARGFVINDYQEYLENKWVASLKEKYPVRMNQAVLASLPK